MQIRKAEKQDLEESARIFKQGVEKEPYNTKTDMEESLCIINEYFKNQVMFVALDQDKIIGFVELPVWGYYCAISHSRFIP